MMATKPQATTTKNKVMAVSSHTGRSVNPLASAWRRRASVFQTSHALATSASTQLQNGPSEPSRPPPIMRKVGSLTGCVLPCATRKAAPRKLISPPSVTTKEGTPR